MAMMMVETATLRREMRINRSRRRQMVAEQTVKEVMQLAAVVRRRKERLRRRRRRSRVRLMGLIQSTPSRKRASNVAWIGGALTSARKRCSRASRQSWTTDQFISSKETSMSTSSKY